MEFAAVDCTTQQGLCSANEVKGYPTIKYFSYYSKVVKHYTGGRTVELFLIINCFFFGLILHFKETEFVQFMSNPESGSLPSEQKEQWRIDSQSILHLTDETFKKAIESNEPVLVMFYAPCKYLGC